MKPLSLSEFFARFGTTEQCLAFLKDRRWPPERYDGGLPCKTCGAVTRHYLIASRKCYSCQRCGRHVHPTVGTLFERSRVPLPDWFYVLYLFARLPGEVTAKQIEQEVGVSYPTALRMHHRIRTRAEEAQALSVCMAARTPAE